MFIAILGAGDLGGALAHKLAQRDRVAEVRLIDAAGAVAAGKALDIQQSGAVEGFRTRVTSASDPRAAAGAAAIVLADAAGSPPAEWQGEPGLALLRGIHAADQTAPVVFAGASQRQLMARGAGELKMAVTRLVGSAPHALVSAARAIVALEAGGSPGDVALSLVGVPPDEVVIGWNAATFAGSPVASVLSAAQMARVQARLASMWPPGPYGLASAAAQVAEALAIGSRRQFVCFAPIRHGDTAGWRVVAIPVELTRGAMRRAAAPPLSVQERVSFENALVRAEA